VEPSPLARRRILVLNERDFDLTTYREPELHNEPGTWVVNFSEAIRPENQGRALKRLTTRRLLRPDAFLLLSPYEDAYEEAEAAEEKFALRKFELFATLCSLLGATRVQASRQDDAGSRGEREASIAAKRLARGEATIRETVEERLKDHLSVTTRLEGSQPEVAKAREFLKRHGLEHDNTMRGLVELFAHSENKVRSQELVLNVTSEASREVAAAAKLSVPAGLSVSGKVRSLHSDTQGVLIRLSVEFPSG
jgi:hypothetical protein